VTGQLDDKHESRFLLNNEADIRTLLSKLQAKRSHVTGHFDNSYHIFPTCLLEVGKNTVVLDDVSDEAISKRILACSRLHFSATHAGVPVSFVSSQIEPCLFEGAAAFSIPIPSVVRWPQRRELFRVPTPFGKPALCEIGLNNGEVVRNPLSDISVGGIGMLTQVSSPTLKQGALFGGCRIDLPGFGELTSDIRICNSADITLKNGHPVRRYGCQFIDLPQQEQSLLQRYVIKLELAMRPPHAHA
jgi:c-di-GMP-binding flagellar brake protein YcgR